MWNKIERPKEEEKKESIGLNKPQAVAFRPVQLIRWESMPLSAFDSCDQFSNNPSITGDAKKWRKRRRLSCEKDLSPETFRKVRNKRLAKESRLRKGNYVK